MTVTQPTAAVLYARKSSREEIKSEGGTSRSVADQLADLRAYAQRAKLRVVEEKYDDAISGRHQANRPGLQDVKALIDSGRADVVVVLNTSRFGRNQPERELTMQDFDQRGIVMHALEQGGPIDRSTSHGWFMDNINGLIDDKFWRDRSAQWSRSLERRVEAGLPKNGLPRFGYRKTKKGGYKPDPTTGPVLAELYQRYTAGAGFQALVAELNARGIPTTRGNTWGAQTLIRALDSGFGAGLLVANDEKGTAASYSPGAHKPVITEEEWDAYQRARTVRRAEPPKRRTVRWALAGIARCGRCGAPAVRNKADGPKSQAICSAYVSKRSCVGVWMKVSDLEARVAIWLGGHLEELAAHAPSRDAERARARQALEDAQRAADDAVTALGRLAGLLARDVLDEDAYAAAQTDLVAERDTAVRAVAAAHEEVFRLQPVDDSVYTRLEASKDLTPGEWARQIGQVLRRVEVHKDRLVIVPVVGEPEVDLR
jgi:site-specific DNA recombinase